MCEHSDVFTYNYKRRKRGDDHFGDNTYQAIQHLEMNREECRYSLIMPIMDISWK